MTTCKSALEPERLNCRPIGLCFEWDVGGHKVGRVGTYLVGRVTAPTQYTHVQAACLLLELTGGTYMRWGWEQTPEQNGSVYYYALTIEHITC